MGVHWALGMLKAILPDEIVAKLQEARNNPHRSTPPDEALSIHDSLTGDVLMKIPTPGIQRFSRRKLRAILTEGIEIQV
jgi:hypothetical protein